MLQSKMGRLATIRPDDLNFLASAFTENFGKQYSQLEAYKQVKAAVSEVVGVGTKVGSFFAGGEGFRNIGRGTVQLADKAVKKLGLAVKTGTKQGFEPQEILRGGFSGKAVARATGLSTSTMDKIEENTGATSKSAERIEVLMKEINRQEFD